MISRLKILEAEPLVPCSYSTRVFSKHMAVCVVNDLGSSLTLWMEGRNIPLRSPDAQSLNAGGWQKEPLSP